MSHAAFRHTFATELQNGQIVTAEADLQISSNLHKPTFNIWPLLNYENEAALIARLFIPNSVIVIFLQLCEQSGSGVSQQVLINTELQISKYVQLFRPIRGRRIPVLGDNQQNCLSHMVGLEDLPVAGPRDHHPT